MTERLRIDRLRVAAGGRVVVDVADFGVAAGELLVAVGSAGSGKTTLAAALTGSVPSDGKVFVDGAPLIGPPSRRRRTGLAGAIRDGNRIAGCTVAEALHLASGGSKRENEALQRFLPLSSRRHVAAEALSGGEQQLLQVAAAWCAAAAVLVLDSPTVGLAADVAKQVAALAIEEAERGIAVIWLEQDRREAPAEPRAELSGGTLSALGVRPASEAGSHQDRV